MKKAGVGQLGISAVRSGFVSIVLREGHLLCRTDGELAPGFRRMWVDIWI